jgi:predicted heme/steroid binding protein
LSTEKKFTLEELAKFDGNNGSPAYVAFKGKVYDVSESSFWMDGDHLGAHQAGKDLTEEIEIAPHGPENLDRVKIVGIL